jgi:hypothetical protein
MDDSLRQLLTVLHRKLDGATSIGKSDRELLKLLSADIQGLLAQSDADSGVRQKSLIDRLETTAARFEDSHPDLTATIMQVCKALGDMGI